MSFKMVGETWIYVSNHGIFCWLDSWQYYFSNRNRNSFFIGYNCYKFEEMIQRVGCNSHSNLIELIKANVFRRRIRAIWGELERDKLVTIFGYIFEKKCFILLSRLLGYPMDINIGAYPTILKSSITLIHFIWYIYMMLQVTSQIVQFSLI